MSRLHEKALKAVFESRYVEVDQKALLEAGQLEIGPQLSFMLFMVKHILGSDRRPGCATQ